MSQVESENEMIPSPKDRLEGVEPADRIDSVSAEHEKRKNKIEDQTRFFYHQAGTFEPKPIQSSPPDTKEQK